MTPIETAAEALDRNYNPDRYPVMAAMFQDYARTVFTSIDRDALARAIDPAIYSKLNPLTADGWAVAKAAADAAIAHLTGEDQ